MHPHTPEARYFAADASGSILSARFQSRSEVARDIRTGEIVDVANVYYLDAANGYGLDVSELIATEVLDAHEARNGNEAVAQHLHGFLIKHLPGGFSLAEQLRDAEPVL